MARTTLDEAISAVFNDRERHHLARPSGARPAPDRRCGGCGVAGHDASTCTAHDVTSSSRDAPPTEGQVPRTTPDEIAHLDEVIAMQHSALAQHQSAVRHWLAAGDEERADAAAWRADYVGGLLAQLQIDRRALCA